MRPSDIMTPTMLMTIDRYTGQPDVRGGAVASTHAREVGVPVLVVAGGGRHRRSVRECSAAVDTRGDRTVADGHQQRVLSLVPVPDATVPAHGRLDRRPRHNRPLRRRLVSAQGDVVVYGHAGQHSQRHLHRSGRRLQVRLLTLAPG